MTELHYEQLRRVAWQVLAWDHDHDALPAGLYLALAVAAADDPEYAQETADRLAERMLVDVAPKACAAYMHGAFSVGATHINNGQDTPGLGGMPAGSSS